MHLGKANAAGGQANDELVGVMERECDDRDAGAAVHGAAINRSLVCVRSASSGGAGMSHHSGLSFGMFSDKQMRTSSGQSHAYRSCGPRTSPITALETSGRR